MSRYDWDFPRSAFTMDCLVLKFMGEECRDVNELFHFKMVNLCYSVCISNTGTIKCKFALQDNPPKRSLVTNPLPIQNQRNSQSHDCDVNPGHRAKGTDIAGLHPCIHAVKESESDDILCSQSAKAPPMCLAVQHSFHVP